MQYIFDFCSDVGHAWKFYGGKNAGCNDDCSCSVPVYHCVVCKDYDYGINDEGAQIIRDCKNETK